MAGETPDERWVAIIASLVGERIVALRVQRGWNTPFELAEKAGLNYNSLRRWEAGGGPPNLAGLLKLTAVFDLKSVEELLAGSPFLDQLGAQAARGTSELLRLREAGEGGSS